MKQLVKNVCGALALCMLASGCGSLFTASNKNKVSNIRPGMTQAQVEGMLGSPDYKRFDGGVEQWEYRSCYYAYGNQPVSVIVDFNDGKVIALDSFDTPQYPAHPVPPVVAVCPSAHPGHPVPPRHSMVLNDKQFDAFFKRIEDEPFDDDRLKLLKEEAGRTDFTCTQCVRLLRLNAFDDDRLQMLRILAPTITDPENGRMIIGLMDFPSSEAEARKLLRSVADR